MMYEIETTAACNVGYIGLLWGMLVGLHEKDVQGGSSKTIEEDISHSVAENGFTICNVRKIKNLKNTYKERKSTMVAKAYMSPQGSFWLTLVKSV